jgi:hypothetical protein
LTVDRGDEKNGQGVINTVSAWAASNRLVLGQNKYRSILGFCNKIISRSPLPAPISSFSYLDPATPTSVAPVKRMPPRIATIKDDVDEFVGIASVLSQTLRRWRYGTRSVESALGASHRLKLPL